MSPLRPWPTRRRRGNWRLERKLETWRQRKRAAHLLHLTAGRGVGLRLGPVEGGSDQVFQRFLLGRLKHALIAVDRQDPALGSRVNLDQSAAGRALDLD